LRFASFVVIYLRPDLHPLECAHAGRTNEKAHLEGRAYVERREKQLLLERDLVGVSRRELLRLHREGRIPDPVLHRIEAELDLEELRLQRLLEPWFRLGPIPARPALSSPGHLAVHPAAAN
jgi:hypothetical protein